MGESQRIDRTRGKTNHAGTWSPVDPRSRNIVRGEWRPSEKFSAQRKHALPGIRERFGELTVTGYKVGVRGGVEQVVVQCSCGGKEHLANVHNLRNGRSSRCNICTKKSSGYWRKKYYGYADIVPDEAHRVRLLNRISAIITRCKPGTGHKNYGGRGIHVAENWLKDRRAFLRHLTTLDGWDSPLLEIDRIDNEKAYMEGNLRFSTRSENMRNRRTLAELENIRYRLCWAEKQIHSCEQCRANYRP